MILFGTNPIAWANDDDRTIGADIATARILDEAGRQIGFDGIENGHRWPDDPEELRVLLGSYGLKFISGWYSTELLTRSVEDEIKAAQAHIARLKHNGCKVMIVCETSNAIHGDAAKPVNDRPRLDAAGMQAFGAKLESFAAYLTSQGLTLVYHHHMGTIVESPEDIDAFMAATGPHTHLLFDAGHCAFGGGDPVAVLTTPRCPGAAFPRQEHPPRCHGTGAGGAAVVPAGRGGRGLHRAGRPGGRHRLRAVAEDPEGANYDGWIVIEAEQDPTVRNPLLYQTLGLATLKRLAREAGLI